MGRSKQYDLQKMLDLYKEGNSYEEIADKCQIKSVQSVRHAIELAAWNLGSGVEI